MKYVYCEVGTDFCVVFRWTSGFKGLCICNYYYHHHHLLLGYVIRDPSIETKLSFCLPKRWTVFSLSALVFLCFNGVHENPLTGFIFESVIFTDFVVGISKYVYKFCGQFILVFTLLMYVRDRPRVRRAPHGEGHVSSDQLTLKHTQPGVDFLRMSFTPQYCCACRTWKVIWWVCAGCKMSRRYDVRRFYSTSLSLQPYSVYTNNLRAWV
jgi:hypothetical protein